MRTRQEVEELEPLDKIGLRRLNAHGIRVAMIINGQYHPPDIVTVSTPNGDLGFRIASSPSRTRRAELWSRRWPGLAAPTP